jgi:hypothetical protein
MPLGWSSPRSSLKKKIEVKQILLYIRTLTEEKNTHTKEKTKQPDKTDVCRLCTYFIVFKSIPLCIGIIKDPILTI